MDCLFDLIDLICRLLPQMDDGYGDYDPLASV
jgi:hypothetical protein